MAHREGNDQGRRRPELPLHKLPTAKNSSSDQRLITLLWKGILSDQQKAALGLLCRTEKARKKDSALAEKTSWVLGLDTERPSWPRTDTKTGVCLMQPQYVAKIVYGGYLLYTQGRIRPPLTEGAARPQCLKYPQSSLVCPNPSCSDGIVWFFSGDLSGLSGIAVLRASSVTRGGVVRWIRSHNAWWWGDCGATQHKGSNGKGARSKKILCDIDPFTVLVKIMAQLCSEFCPTMWNRNRLVFADRLETFHAEDRSMTRVDLLAQNPCAGPMSTRLHARSQASSWYGITADSWPCRSYRASESWMRSSWGSADQDGSQGICGSAHGRIQFASITSGHWCPRLISAE